MRSSSTFLAFLSVAVLSLTSCAEFQVDHVDPEFAKQGIKGGVICLRCLPLPDQPRGMPPAEERQLLHELRLGLIAAQKDRVTVLEPSVRGALARADYRFEIAIIRDQTESFVDRDEETTIREESCGEDGKSKHLVTEVEAYVTKNCHRRTVRACYRLVRIPNQRCLWQATAQQTITDTREARDSLRYPPVPGPPSGPLVSEVLRRLTKKACAKLP